MKKIWFDLDNSPHVPIFRPIFYELKKRNIEFIITARNFAQTIELLNLWGIEHLAIGMHAGKNKIKKILNLPVRSIQLYSAVNKIPLNLAVSHGSRTQLIASKAIGIKSVLMMDYEYTEKFIFNHFATYLLIPELIPVSRLKKAGVNLKKVIQYKGFKEELYLPYFYPDPTFRAKIGVDENLLVVIRPPSLVGNYHDPKSEMLLLNVIEHFLKNKDAVILITARTELDRNLIKTRFPKNINIRFLKNVVDGLQLLYAADVAISGGGTMNRESALLGTETYSIFTGRRPYLDEYLQENKKLKFIESIKDILEIDNLKRRKKGTLKFNNNLSSDITDAIISIAIK